MFDKLFENVGKFLSYANNDLFTSAQETLVEVTPAYAQKGSNCLAWTVGFASSFAVPACIIGQSMQHFMPAKDMIIGSVSSLSVSSVTSTITSPSKLFSLAGAAAAMAAASTLVYSSTVMAKNSAKEFGGAFTSVKDDSKEKEMFKVPGTKMEIAKCSFLQFATRNRTGSLNFEKGTDLIKAAGNVLTFGLAMTAIGAALPVLLGKGDLTLAAKFTGATFVSYLAQKELLPSKGAGRGIGGNSSEN